MNILSIDLGSYSVKFQESFIEKKKTTVLNCVEVVIEDFLNANQDLNSAALSQVHISIISEYLSKLENSARVIFQLPFEMVTSRFIDIPIKNKKKAELMLPFQLEEDIPYTLAETHIAYHLQVAKNHTEASIAVSQKEHFEDYFNSLKSKNIIPYILTFEASAYSHFIYKEAISVPTCILDIGHSLTKAYFFNEGELVAVNSSYVAGQTVDEAIINHYQIPYHEALQYKHKSCYLLTKGQYEDVTEEQKDFALLMHDVFSQLVAHFKRWEIGYRIKHGNKIANVLITGGSSNIKNITNYLAQALDIRVQKLDSFQKNSITSIGESEKLRFNLSQMMAVGTRGKSKLINFLTGEYAQASSDDLPLNSIVFMGVRMSFVTMLLLLFLGIEYFKLNSEVKDLDIRIGQNFLKNPVLELTPRDRRNYQSQPDIVFDKLKRKRKFISQEIKTIQAASKINAVYPLVKLSNIAGIYTKTELISIESDESGFVKAVFTGEDVKDLRQIEASVKNSEFSNILTDLNELKKILRLEFNF